MISFQWSHKKGCDGWLHRLELKLLGSQGMYVVFAKDDQGSSMGQIVRLGDALEVEDGSVTERLRIKFLWSKRSSSEDDQG
ncbi:hypothetical protein F2Q69_00020768 [Brassica cretica]|uniref:Uncharacterized protein n=1 Tax=Brassica cretica TaxID=69181 RepID=A0A8S9QFN8_BRACR|nr:hypothetical protein F2Q69_00020768 [Brassica cretica]